MERGNTGATRQARDVLAGGWPRIWISVRHGSRTPDNHADFLLAVVRRIFHSFPLASIVFDGFSFPVGFLSDPRTLASRESFMARATLDGRFIDFVCGRIAEEFGSNVQSRLCATSGLDIVEAIAVAACCNYYVCHSGTLQHKIG
jgi:hypothetical protein